MNSRIALPCPALPCPFAIAALKGRLINRCAPRGDVGLHLTTELGSCAAITITTTIAIAIAIVVVVVVVVVVVITGGTFEASPPFPRTVLRMPGPSDDNNDSSGRHRTEGLSALFL